MFHKVDNIFDRKSDEKKYDDLMSKRSSFEKQIEDVDEAIRVNAEERFGLRQKMFLVHCVKPHPDLPVSLRNNIFFRIADYHKDDCTPEGAKELEIYKQMDVILRNQSQELQTMKEACIAEINKINLELRKLTHPSDEDFTVSVKPR